MICEEEHIGHELLEHSKILVKNNDLLNSMKDLNNVIDNFKYKISIIKEILDRLVNTFDLYYKINNNIINNYNINKRNYYILQNLNNIICNICNINNKGNTHNNEFYVCNTCNINICPLCKTKHDKNHNIINYEDRNYICKKHKDEKFSIIK